MQKVYAIYKGEECLGVGTAYELSKKMAIKADTIRWYSTPNNHRRNKGLRKIAIVVEEEVE